MAAAYLAAKRTGPGQVTLIEDAATPGGLWRSFDYGAQGRFDHGMHNYFECGIPEIDDFFFGVLDDSQFAVLEGDNRDFAGLYYRGKLQSNSPSIDLRHISPAEKERCLREVLAAASKTGVSRSESAMGFAVEHWGPTLAHNYIKPIIERQFGQPATELTLAALGLSGLWRVVLLGQADMLEKMKIDSVRARLAFPDQRQLPAQYASGRRGLYPRRPGLSQLTDAVMSALEALGVEVLLSSRITSMQQENGRVVELVIAHDNTEHTLPCTQLIWSAGMRPLAPLLDVPVPEFGNMTPPRFVTVVNLLADAPLNDKGLHYFYSYDSDSMAFRVTCYRNFCAEAVTNEGGIPYAIELLDTPTDEAEAQAVKEFLAFGLIEPGEEKRLSIVASEPAGRIFPMPTIGNEGAFDAMRSGIADKRVFNLSLIGSQATKRVFFQPEILRHVHDTVDNLRLGI